jgi:hypothetical protein
MKRRIGLLVGLGLGLVVLLLAASAGRSIVAPAQAWSMQYQTVAPSDTGQPEPSSGPPACPPTTITSPVWWDTPPQSGSLITLPSGQQIIEPGPEDTVRVIILLEGEPVSGFMSRLCPRGGQLSAVLQDEVRGYAGQVQESHQQVLRQLDARGIGLELRREYSYLLNGLAGSIQMADMERIAALPEVQAVYPDYEVRALLEESVPLIGADQVWAMLDPSGQPLTGHGIRVAVIDTGIDYNHPDLGGGFGPGYKVVRGYDFHNGDDDPMDDYGHGTHVAGIVAANGGLKGVAPDASLYAYKVLDEEGRGSSSNIIAGIERATDPDSDPTTDDAVEVINLSLGGKGDPDHPLSLAVDAAVGQGVVVAVAIGTNT